MIVGHIGGSASDIDTGDIQKSLRFAASRSTYLSKLYGATATSTQATFSVWVKRGKLGVSQSVFNSTYDGSNRYLLTFADTDNLILYGIAGGSLIYHKVTTAVFRDTSSWYHICVVLDSPSGTAADRNQIWVNGARITSFSTDGNSLVNAQMFAVSNTWSPMIFGADSISGYYHDGYLSRVCFVDGAALTPSSFGYQNTEINEWVTKSQSAVKAVVDAGGANSFMLDFDDGTSLTTLGYDKSSKGNNWTLNNHSLTTGANYDWMEDVPGNSFATLNPLALGDATLQDGNLQVYCGVLAWLSRVGTIVASTGKLYAEGTGNPTTVSTYTAFGIRGVGTNLGNGEYPGSTSTSYGVVINTTSAFAYNNAATTQNITGTFSTSTPTMVAVDFDAGKIWLGCGGSWIGGGDPAAGTSPTYTFTANTPMVFHAAAYNGSSVMAGNFGQRPFTYTPPTGFKALNQRNLPDGSSVTLSGSFTGNAAVDGPAVWLNGSPDTLTINGNAVTFGTHADRLATGFKVRSSSASYNTAGSNTFVATVTSNLKNCFKYNNAKDNT